MPSRVTISCTFNYLTALGVEHSFKSVVITLHLNNRNTLFDVYSQRLTTHVFGYQLISSPIGQVVSIR